MSCPDQGKHSFCDTCGQGDVPCWFMSLVDSVFRLFGCTLDDKKEEVEIDPDTLPPDRRREYLYTQRRKRRWDYERLLNKGYSSADAYKKVYGSPVAKKNPTPEEERENLCADLVSIGYSKERARRIAAEAKVPVTFAKSSPVSIEDVVETTVYRKDLHPETMVQKCRVDVDVDHVLGTLTDKE